MFRFPTGTQRICEKVRIAAFAVLELRSKNSFDDVTDDATVIVVMKASANPEVDVARVFVGVVQELNVLWKYF